MLLDTCVWTPLSDLRRAMTMRATLKGVGRRGAVSPLNIDEITRTPVIADRDTALGVACKRWWDRLLPVGLLDIEQLVASVRRHRPRWLWNEPDLRTWTYERGAYLTGNDTSFWRAVRAHPGAFVARAHLTDEIRRAQQATTKLARAQSPHFDSSDVAAAMITPISVSLPGTVVHGRAIEAWRYQCAISLPGFLDVRQSGPMVARWFDCFVDRSAITADDWWSFWADATTPAEVSRHWLRCAVFHLQASRRVNHGVAGDLAIACHLVDVGTFATFDRAFAEIIDKLRPAAPFPIAQVVHAGGLPDLLDRLASIGPVTSD